MLVTEVMMMSYAIKIRTGFFETARCELSFSGKTIRLSSERLKNNEVVIHDDELISLCITKKPEAYSELEICTDKKMYVGTLEDETAVRDVIAELSEVFSKKLIIEMEE